MPDICDLKAGIGAPEGRQQSVLKRGKFLNVIESSMSATLGRLLVFLVRICLCLCYLNTSFYLLNIISGFTQTRKTLIRIIVIQ